jgi:hypothetical protein
MCLQRDVPLLFGVLAAASHWRSDLMEGWRRLRAFIVVTGVAWSISDKLFPSSAARQLDQLSGTRGVRVQPGYHSQHRVLASSINVSK